MEKLKSKIIIEDYKKNFDYKKNNTSLNIEFNRVAFVFFFFFIIYLIYTIHLIHLGSRKSKMKLNNNVPTFSNKLYRADIIDINDNYLAKTVKSIDIGIRTSDVIDEKKLLLSLNIIFPNKDVNKIKKATRYKKIFLVRKKGLRGKL
jgi:cell division protein FtsI (penicillin-binding protein 3)